MRSTFQIVVILTVLATFVNSSYVSLSLSDQEWADEHQRILAYWTKERMESAVPIEELLKDQLEKRLHRTLSSNFTFPIGQPLTIYGKNPSSPTDSLVHQTAGRVFGTIDGGNFVGSGNVIASTNNDIVVTAAHCVYDISRGKFVDNFVFAPGYDRGNSPFGRWTFRRAVVRREWIDDVPEVMNWDVGYALMGTLNGQHIANVVGSQSIAFNNQRGTYRHIFGYPCNIQNCEALIESEGTALVYPDPKFLGEGTPSRGMGGGASGGPTLANFDTDTGRGTQVSVLSFSISTVQNVLWGPYFGNDARDLYNSIESAP